MEMRQIFYKVPSVDLFENGDFMFNRKWPVRLNGYLVEVEDNFVSDANSVPRLVRWLVPQYGNVNLMGGLHDWLYYAGEVFCVAKGQMVKIRRKQADQFALAVGKKCQVSWRVRMRWYIGVRIGGGRTWRNYRLTDRIRKAERVLTTDCTE